ncbi:hypothetical protein FRC07_000603 [Ceratobasidium sp. 392]|nr:hypothetical protein FRC07_000603 [Ceratobasidium sp. 392]
MSKRFDGREDLAQRKPDDTPQFRSEGTSAEEAASIAAMFQASQEVWDETQEKMAQATPVYSNRGGFRGGKPFNQGNRGPGGEGGAGGSGGGFQRQESRPVPLGYICYRCGKKGHWIHECPTNDDRDWDNRPRVKRTTGIPRSFLKTVEQPNDGPLGQGVMVTPDGGFVVAQPDSAAWQKQRARPKALTSSEIYAAPAPAAHSDLACPICERLTKNAVRTPCCRTTYCEECIQTYLLDHDFVCRCGKKIASFDRLEADEKRREQVGEVVRSMIEESRKESTKQEPEDTLPQSSSTNTIASTTSTSTSTTANTTDTSTPPPNSGNATPGQGQDTSQQDLASLQAQFAQLSQMLTNPGLPQAARQQAQRQAMKINAEMQKIMMGSMGGMGGGMNAGMGGMGMNTGGGGPGPGMGMGMGMNMNGPMGGGNQGGPMMGPGMGGGGMGMGMGNMGNGMGMGPGMMNNGMGMNMGMGNMGMGINMGGGMPGMNGMGMNPMMGGMGMPNPMMMQNNPNRMMGMNMGGPGPMMGGPGGPMMGHHNPMMGGPGAGGPMMGAGGGGQNWTNPFSNQQPAGNESAYQRLPVHNRRKKRDRPSDFVEVGGDQSKVPRYWE